MEVAIIYFSSNRFDANIQDFSGLLNGGLFAAEVEIFMLLIAAHSETALRVRRLRINYNFLYYTYKFATILFSLLSYYSW